MTPVERYLHELAAALRVRGRRRRRILAECAAHLHEAAATRGEAAAVEAFGPPAEIARVLDLEAAAGRAVTSTGMSIAGVSLTAVSTLALIHGAADVHAALGPALVFLVAAQIAGVAAGVALLQALAQRRLAQSAAALALLTRRNAVAVGAAGVAMLAAGVALPGQGSAAALLAGPVTLAAAVVALVRARRLTHALPGARERTVSSPLDDLGALAGVSLPAGLRAIDPLRHAALSAMVVAVLAGAALLARQLGEGAGPAAACALGAFEAAAVLGSFVLLGPALGLRRTR